MHRVSRGPWSLGRVLDHRDLGCLSLHRQVLVIRQRPTSPAWEAAPGLAMTNMRRSGVIFERDKP